MNEVDMRSLFPPVGDQGKRETCLAFAVTAAHEADRLRTIGSFEDLSEETLHWKCKQIDNDQQPGTSFATISVALEYTGQPHEDRWPYDLLRNESDSSYVPPADAIIPEHCFMAPLTTIAATGEEIQDSLQQGRTVVLGIPLCDSFYLSPAGRVVVPPATTAIVGGHAVAVVGYEEDEKKQRWLIFRNSWGEGWGDQDYGYLPYEYLEKYDGSAAIIER